jgi:CRISPR-associated protein Cmr4
VYGRCRVFLGAAVTPVHVGIGRSPGAVDLPVARDGFGVPFIPASSLKGSTKSLCFNLMDQRLCERIYGWDIRISGAAPPEPYISPTAFTDALLLLYPVRVERGDNVGFAYATSLLQLRRLLDILELCRASRGDASCLESVGDLVMLGASSGCTGSAGTIYINNVELDPCKYVYLDQHNERARLLLEQVERIGVALAGHVASGGIYVVLDDELFREIVEAGLIRQTRVSLDPATKTVRTGALWSEEYISQGAVFAYATLFRDSNNIPADEAEERHINLLSMANNYLVIGGKETIGRGIIRLHQACNQ